MNEQSDSCKSLQRSRESRIERSCATQTKPPLHVLSLSRSGDPDPVPALCFSPLPKSARCALCTRGGKPVVAAVLRDPQNWCAQSIPIRARSTVGQMRDGKLWAAALAQNCRAWWATWFQSGRASTGRPLQAAAARATTRRRPDGQPLVSTASVLPICLATILGGSIYSRARRRSFSGRLGSGRNHSWLHSFPLKRSVRASHCGRRCERAGALFAGRRGSHEQRRQPASQSGGTPPDNSTQSWSLREGTNTLSLGPSWPQRAALWPQRGDSMRVPWKRPACARSIAGWWSVLFQQRAA